MTCNEWIFSRETRVVAYFSGDQRALPFSQYKINDHYKVYCDHCVVVQYLNHLHDYVIHRQEQFNHKNRKFNNSVIYNSVRLLRPIQYGRHFSRRYFQANFLEWNIMNFDQNALKFVPNSTINNKQTLVHITAWRWTGDNPLSEPIVA